MPQTFRPKLAGSILAVVALLAALLASGTGWGEQQASAGNVGAAGKGEILISNRSDHAIDCTVPGYRGGASFGIEDHSARPLIVAEFTGRKVIDEVTCGGKSIQLIEFTTDSENLELQYRSDDRFVVDGYVYLHAHLYVGQECVSFDPYESVKYWAETRKGFCEGTYAEGTAPYSGRAGISAWKHPNGDLAGKILIEMGTEAGHERLGVGFECIVLSRDSPDCYTDSDQRGIDAGAPGGPLKLDVHNDTTSLHYIFIRGWCAKNDRGCVAHQLDGG